MKIRNGFVSNSSSSSFVVYGRDPSKMIHTLPKELYTKSYRYGRNVDNIVLPFTEAQMEFGWQFERYYDIKDRINFCAAMIMDMPENIRYEHKRMLETVIEKHISDDEYVEIVYDYNFFFWDSIESEKLYIDHQSSWREGRNTELFESEKNLEDFIFNSESFIQCGNGNEDKTDEWEEAYALREMSIHKLIEPGTKFKFDYCYGTKAEPKEGFSPDAVVEFKVKSAEDNTYCFEVTDKGQSYEIYSGNRYDCEKMIYIYFKDLAEVTE